MVIVPLKAVSDGSIEAYREPPEMLMRSLRCSGSSGANSQ